MKKRILSVLLCLAMTVGVLTGCSRGDNSGTQNNNETTNQQNQSDNGGNQGTAQQKGRVYYLSFKPESDRVWQDLAAQYTQETGVPVKVVTAASNTYEQTLMSEIANAEAPTLFQVNGPIGYESWKDYCADLKDTKLYSWLLDKDLAITGEDGGVYAIPYVVEGYGIIYNEAIMDKYFEMDGAKVADMDDIKNFATLKAVVEDMQAKRDKLGIKGVFASTSLTPGEDW
ncbi:MAG: ABC transporter substrate-binding protein, partial [Lachnospiraceae bacterium]|nr:ABC transporter substrate-binding protein [Lachnospiraceae bacterium]